MKISTFIMVMAIAFLSFSFSEIKTFRKSGKLEMRLSFPLLKKKFPACNDSSFLARIVICNNSDTVVTLTQPLNLAFEVQTATSKYLIEKREHTKDGYKILFPGDSVVLNCLLTSESCQPTLFTRRIPKPSEGLRSIRAILQSFGEDEEDDQVKTAGFAEQANRRQLTAPGPDKQRNAVRRENVRNTPVEISRSIFRGTVSSNSVKFQ